MTRNWHLGEPGWSWPDDVDATGTEKRAANRYLPVLNTERYADNVIREWEVARVFVDEDDAEMLDDARLIAAAPLLLSIVAGLAAQLREMLAGTCPEPNETSWRDILADCDHALARTEGKT